jgi:hypothetical protein
MTPPPAQLAAPAYSLGAPKAGAAFRLGSTAPAAQWPGVVTPRSSRSAVEQQPDG